MTGKADDEDELWILRPNIFKRGITTGDVIKKKKKETWRPCVKIGETGTMLE